MDLTALLESTANTRIDALADRDRIEKLNDAAWKVQDYKCFPSSIKRLRDIAFRAAQIGVRSIGRLEALADNAGLAADESAKTIAALQSQLAQITSTAWSLIEATRDLTPGIAALTAEVLELRKRCPPELIDVAEHDLASK